MSKVLDNSLAISEFELPSRNYVHLRTNTLGKGIDPPSYGLIVILWFFYKDSHAIKQQKKNGPYSSRSAWFDAVY